MRKEQTFVRSLFTCLISAVIIFSKPKLAISALISSRTLVEKWVYLRSKYLKSGLSPRICALWLLYLCREWGHTNARTFMSNIKRQLKSKVKVTPNVHEQRNRQTVLYTYNGILSRNYSISVAQHMLALTWWLSDKEPSCQCRRLGFNPWVRKILGRRKWQSTPVVLLG